MSEAKLISPLLDNHAVGSPVSEHHGVSCYPAMDMTSQQKYIIKVISLPASQSQLDAFLLSGAYPDMEAALRYFRELADDTVQEADLLQRLARLEGFVAYEGWQTVPKEDGSGYDVYLKGSYRPTLERYLSRQPMTHLGAVNLGLDLCAALSACRRSGYLYADVKPGNVFICNGREYRLGDLGFIRLSSLQYASLPDKYISSYTAPEITDAYSALNTTLDTYAVGLILYQLYNNAQLPFTGRAPSEPLPPPPYADYEMAEIILKACDPNPENRWEDPAQMGQALVSYLQRNNVNDTPILPPVIPEPMTDSEPVDEEPAVEEVPVEEAPVEEAAPEEVPAEEAAPEEAPAEETVAEEAPVEEAAPEEAPAEETVAEEAPAEETAPEEVPAEEATPEEAPAEEAAPEEVPAEEATPEEAPAEEAEPEETPAVEAAPEEAPVEEAPELSEAEKELAILNELLQDETAPTEENTAGLDDSVVSEETNAILAQADELIAMELPEPVVAPEPIEIPIPPRIQPEPVEEVPAEAEEAPVEVPEAESPADTEEAAGFDVIMEPQTPSASALHRSDEGEDEVPMPRPRKSYAGLIAGLTVLLLLILLALGGYLYYTNYYLQSVDGLTLQASDNQLTVYLDTEIDNHLLTVTCTDTYGNVKHASVQNNTALFVDLRPDTNYRINVQIQGFHQLTGTTTGTHSTAAQTTIAGFTGVTGSEDGSVILNFTVQGPETASWRVAYRAPGEAEKKMDFTGHMVTVTGLTVGKEYTFRLESPDGLYLVGADTLVYTATKIIYAQNLTTQGFHSGALTATWEAPEGSNVASWTVRCYNDTGYDNTVIVTGTKAIFQNLDAAAAYTIEVTAEGMSVGSRTYVSANSVTFTDIQADASDRKQLTVSWRYEGTAPKDGWLVLYTADGCEPNVIQCAGNATSAVISPLIPGARYEITIQPTGGGTVFGGSYTFDAPAAPLFSGYWVSCEHMVFSMCKRPEKDSWNHNDVTAQNYTTTFRSGEKASFVVKLNHEYDTSRDKIEILFVIRNARNTPVSFHTISRTWLNMWYQGYGTLDVPVLPEAAGNYTVEIYYNGTSVTTQSFSIV